MDLTGYNAFFEGKLTDYAMPEEDLAKSVAAMQGHPVPPPLA
jgi:hypothetical protein